MSNILQSENQTVDYQQGVTQRKNSTTVDSGSDGGESFNKSTSSGTSTSKNQQKSDTSRTSESEGNRNQKSEFKKLGSSETTRDLTTSSTNKRSSNEKANVGFSIKFTIPITGRKPQAGDRNC